jgi:hypothetical protein
MSFFKAIKEFFTGTPAQTVPVHVPPAPVVPTLDPSGWPFQDVSPEAATTSNEVVIKPNAKKKRPAKPKASAGQETAAAPAPKTEPKTKKAPAAINAAPAKSKSKRVRKTNPSA